MLQKKRTAIIFTANTIHIAYADLMLNSLRNNGKGNFQGDLWVISTGLSDRDCLQEPRIFWIVLV